MYTRSVSWNTVLDITSISRWKNYLIFLPFLNSDLMCEICIDFSLQTWSTFFSKTISEQWAHEFFLIIKYKILNILNYKILSRVILLDF